MDGIRDVAGFDEGHEEDFRVYKDKRAEILALPNEVEVRDVEGEDTEREYLLEALWI